MHHCPVCGSPDIHRSQARSLLERIRKSLSGHRPHRCHACGWRGWGPPTGKSVPEDWIAQHDPPDLAAIDDVLTTRKG